MSGRDDFVPAATGREAPREGPGRESMREDERGPDDLVPPASPEPPTLVVAATPEPLLDLVRGALRAVTMLSPLPVGRDRWVFGLARPAGGAVAEVYVATWVAVLVACLVLGDGEAGPYAAGVALFRYGDLVATQALVLLDPVGLRVGDPRRALALVGLHVVEVTLIVGTVFRWIVGERIGSAFVTALEVVTLQGRDRHPGNWIEAIRVLGAGGMALLAVATLVIAVRIGRER